MHTRPEDFIHPEDQAALENLRSVPFFSECLKLFLKVFSEQQFHGTNMAQKIRLGPNQLPDVYRHLPPICQTLGIAEPEFYLEMDPTPNAYTFGDTRIFVTITSGLVEYLTEEEIRAVLAHECGHVVCHHVLYHTMAHYIVQLGDAFFGLPGLALKPVMWSLFYWSLRSELSADRAAALVMRDSQPVVETMIRLSGGPKSLTGKVNLEAYIKQAEAYDRLLDSNWDKALQSFAVRYFSHPFPAVRAREISKWCDTDQFRRLLKGLDNTVQTGRCASCGAVLEPEWKFCRYCGQRVAFARTLPK